MADRLLLPSSADLTRAFVKDLGNVLDTEGARTTFTLVMNVPTTATMSWTADVACTLIGVLCVPNGTAMCVSRDGTTTTVATASNTKFVRNIILVLQNPSSGGPFNINYLREPFQIGEKLYVQSGAAGLTLLNFVFERD